MNDTSGWTLVHDRMRAVLDDAIEQVQALGDADRPAAALLSEWWRSFSRSVRHHFRSEDEHVWPVLVVAEPGSRAGLEELPDAHHDLGRLLSDADRALTGLVAAVRRGSLRA